MMVRTVSGIIRKMAVANAAMWLHDYVTDRINTNMPKWKIEAVLYDWQLEEIAIKKYNEMFGD
jgi:hypothetical protein